MNIAVLVAGGTGTRMGVKIPKQFIKINQRPIISYTLEEFQKAQTIDKIHVVTLEEYFTEIEKIVKDYKITKFVSSVKNGNTRQESVSNALEEIKSYADKDDIILIHDAVRAMIDSENINLCVKETQKSSCTTLAKKVSDTIAQTSEKNIQGYLDRNTLYSIETPQSFKFNIIYSSHLKAKKENKNFTDDTQVAINNGYDVKIIENEKMNIKITTKKDLLLFRYYLENN